ncbi:hypothetical protein H6P81_015872 [Aristolochia fimbriata]|uniref:Reverse transcriptase Ty1/copia-type domain-containing protein n=1 Tax=Aristolochia fimbriata TaxID=158543 RepID=A0AAV7E6S6_ARIFI|nr:hypothetical protein H6P81_015872 [Aristolochia fimbriata]
MGSRSKAISSTAYWLQMGVSTQTESDGSINRFKARLVAKGFHQQEGLDFFETFSPVVKQTTIRVLLSLAITYKWHITQLDIKNVFLHGELREEVYMSQPLGFINPAYPEYVCRLKRSLYGLKQSPRARGSPSVSHDHTPGYSVHSESGMPISAVPTDVHWAAVKRIFRYIKGTISHGLVFCPTDSFDIHAFSDADWAGNPDDRRSTTGYSVFLGGNLVSWSSRKQPTVSRSSAEAEYRALASTMSEISWLLQLMQEVHVRISQAPMVWCDNISATFIAANPVFHARTKHIELDYYFVRERIAKGALQVKYIPTMDQVSDIFTKGLSRTSHSRLSVKLSVSPRPLSLRGNVNGRELPMIADQDRSLPRQAR